MKDTAYWVFQFQAMVEFWVMVKFAVVPDPEAGTSPVPVQPVQKYCVPAGPGAGDVTVAETLVPFKYDVVPLGFGES